MKFLFLFAFLLSLLCVYGDKTIHTPNNVAVSLVGESGKIRLTYNTNWIQLSWLKLQEIDSNGDVVQSVNNFASIPDFDWDEPTHTIIQGQNATVISIFGTVTIGNNGVNAPTADFGVTVYMFPQQITMETGNTTVLVPIDTIKFNVICNQWPFESIHNRLQFGVTLSSHGGIHPTTPTKTYSDVLTHNGTVVEFGAGGLVAPQKAIIDGSEKDIIVHLNTNELVWSFPYFEYTLLYDPVFAVDEITTISSANTHTVSVFTFLTCIVLINILHF
jgi:hypothetical protein